MAHTALETVLAQVEAYRSQDAAAAEALLDDDLRFTSPQDDHIDKTAFMERCFPTASRFGRQEIRHAVEIAPGVVLLSYVAAGPDGSAFSNAEITHVRNGRITEIRVYFGGPDAFDGDRPVGPSQ